MVKTVTAVKIKRNTQCSKMQIFIVFQQEVLSTDFIRLRDDVKLEKPVAFSKEAFYVNTIFVAFCTSIKLLRQEDCFRRTWGR